MEKVLMVYWTSTGNTEMLAEAIRDEIQDSAEVTFVNVSDETPSLDGYDRYIFGCPATGTEELDEGEFEPWFSDVESQLADKKIALFGCYGWGGGPWMRAWEERVKEANGKLFEEGFICLETPDDEVLEEVKAFGKRFLEF